MVELTVIEPTTSLSSLFTKKSLCFQRDQIEWRCYILNIFLTSIPSVVNPTCVGGRFFHGIRYLSKHFVDYYLESPHI